MLADMQRLADITRPLLAQLEAIFPSTVSPTAFDTAHPVPVVPTLDLSIEYEVEGELVKRGCSPEMVECLAEAFRDGVRDLSVNAQTGFEATCRRLPHAPTNTSLRDLWDALKSQYTHAYRKQVLLLEADLLAEVDEARANVQREAAKRSSSPSPEPTAAPGPDHLKGGHSAAAVAVLMAFRDQRLAAGKEAKFNAAERRLIAEKTGLSDQQVLTWFSNYRNRSMKLERRLASTKFSTKGGARFSPYETPRRPSAQSQSTASRDLSSSSCASMDSTLSYAPAEPAPAQPLTISPDEFMASSWSGSESSGDEQLYEQDALLRLLEPTPSRSSAVPFSSPPTHHATTSSFPTYTAPATYTPVPYSHHTAMYLDSPAPYPHQAYVPVQATHEDAYRAPEPWFPSIPSPRSTSFEYMFTSGDFDVARALGVDNGRGALTLPIQAGGSGMSH